MNMKDTQMRCSSQYPGGASADSTDNVPAVLVQQEGVRATPYVLARHAEAEFKEIRINL